MRSLFLWLSLARNILQLPSPPPLPSSPPPPPPSSLIIPRKRDPEIVPLPRRCSLGRRRRWRREVDRALRP